MTDRCVSVCERERVRERTMRKDEIKEEIQ